MNKEHVIFSHKINNYAFFNILFNFYKFDLFFLLIQFIFFIDKIEEMEKYYTEKNV